MVITKFCSLLTALVLITPIAQAQIAPDAPIRDFRYPMFNDDGYRVWEVRGVQGIFIDLNNTEIIGLELTVFSGDERDAQSHRILSPKALVDFTRRGAAGPSSIFITGPGFQVEGESWQYDGRSQRIVIGKRARMTFAEDLNILR
ncbi:MAG: hypothetical protein LR015_06530 [Verrucomicrobia bacterium]|nr:hypothetical protein [Verrucomicrobiota bacterium]